MVKKQADSRGSSKHAVKPGTTDFRDFLAGNGVALMDGAMGTMLYSKGVFIHRAFEALNVEEPGLVLDVHRRYVDAGADIVETNTFSANRFRLSSFGISDKVERINREGAELAKQAAEGRAWVAGAMGPLGARIEPFGQIGKDEAQEIFAEQAKALIAGGVDLIVLETFTHFPELLEAVRAVRDQSDIPVAALLRFAEGGLTREGVSPEQIIDEFAGMNVDVLGVNCCEPLATLDALVEFSALGNQPLCAQPNAGHPHAVGGRNIYMGSPEYMVAWGRRAIRGGARLIGGCCGTTPEHVRAMRAIVGSVEPAIDKARLVRPKHRKAVTPPVEITRKSKLASALKRGRFVKGVMLPPLRGWVIDEVVSAARTLALGGVDFVTLREGPPALPHLPPVSLARSCEQAGIEPVIQYTCRGRRLVRIQADLLGACAAGVANLLVTTGDPLIVGMEQDAWPDLEVDSIGTVNLVVRLNHGEDMAGNPIGQPTAIHVGARVDPTAYDQENEYSRLEWKIDAETEYFMTTPIFDPASLQRVIKVLRLHDIPLIATIWPLRSAQEAELFEQSHEAVPVPETLIERMRQAESRGEEHEEGLIIAKEICAAIASEVSGVQIVASGGTLEEAIDLLESVES